MGCADVVGWVERQNSRASSEAREIRLDQQTDWLFDGSEIRHRHGRFFSIAGFAHQSDGSLRTGPLILQSEIGCLGWVTRCASAGTEFLLQAKYEPGNCNGTQIAPTVQATKSNQDRVHGGARVPFVELFQPGGPTPTMDSLQTEESDRFFRKVNRNVAVNINSDLPHSEQFRWCGLPVLKHLLTLSYTVNTDARSVLACMDWRLFQDHRPSDPALSSSFQRSLDLNSDLPAVQELLTAARAGFGEVRQVSLTELPGWQITSFGLDAPDAPFSVRHFQVRTQVREVSEWSQPFLLSHSHGLCLLALSIQAGVARAYLRIRQALGVRDGAEIGPSLQLAPGQSPATLDLLDNTLLQAARQGRLLAEADNSQEGSRFFQDCVRYRIVLIDHRQVPNTSDAAWATLGTLKHLIGCSGIVANEMRSAVSFLLPLL